eukprot:jgi/Bigna1/88889/estExt_fgenesh1_pg.C_400014
MDICQSTYEEQYRVSFRQLDEIEKLLPLEKAMYNLCTEEESAQFHKLNVAFSTEKGIQPTEHTVNSGILGDIRAGEAKVLKYCNFNDEDLEKEMLRESRSKGYLISVCSRLFKSLHPTYVNIATSIRNTRSTNFFEKDFITRYTAALKTLRAINAITVRSKEFEDAEEIHTESDTTTSIIKRKTKSRRANLKVRFKNPSRQEWLKDTKIDTERFSRYPKKNIKCVDGSHLEVVVSKSKRRAIDQKEQEEKERLRAHKLAQKNRRMHQRRYGTYGMSFDYDYNNHSNYGFYGVVHGYPDHGTHHYHGYTCRDPYEGSSSFGYRHSDYDAKTPTLASSSYNGSRFSSSSPRSTLARTTESCHATSSGASAAGWESTSKATYKNSPKFQRHCSRGTKISSSPKMSHSNVSAPSIAGKPINKAVKSELPALEDVNGSLTSPSGSRCHKHSSTRHKNCPHDGQSDKFYSSPKVVKYLPMNRKVNPSQREHRACRFNYSWQCERKSRKSKKKSNHQLWW